MVVEVLAWSLIVLPSVLAVVCATFAVAAWIWARPEQVRILQAAMAHLESETASRLNTLQIVRQEAAVDLENANRERDLAQDYNKRSSARDNRARGRQQGQEEPTGGQVGGSRFGH